MTSLRNLVFATAVSLCSMLPSPQRAKAFEFAGAWATSADQCGEVFTREGRANKVSFTNFSGVHGGGFISREFPGMEGMDVKDHRCRI